MSDAIPATAQLVVVGAGPGGYHAAFKAAELGLAVTLIDPAINPGGVCLYRGCIPSKALLHVAKLVDEAHESAAIGVKPTSRPCSGTAARLASMRPCRKGI